MDVMMCSSNIFLGEEGGSRDFESSRIVILPVPYDKTSTWVKGSDKGPLSVIESSSALEFYDIETDSEVYKSGIYTSEAVHDDDSPEGMVNNVANKVRSFIESDKFVVVLGGEHSVSIGAIKAFSEKYEDLCVLHLDAHADQRNEYLGSKFNHACVISRAKEICPVTSVGIRSMDITEKDSVDKKRTFFAHEVMAGSSAGGKYEWVNRVVSGLSRNVYVTIDLDVFDPSLMPSTGTPEPGGLGWYEVITLLSRVSDSKNIVGFDCVELCPQKDNKAPDFIAAKLIYQTLSYVFK